MSQLHKKITHKLEILHRLLDQMAEVKVVDPADPNTWDADTLYNLIELLKEALILLEDKKTKPLNLSLTGGEEIIVESGLCSLVLDSCQEEND